MKITKHVETIGNIYIFEEVIDEGAMGDDEPVIVWSHTNTREYASHLRTHKAFPDNHDVFDNVPKDDFSMKITDLLLSKISD